MSVLSFSFKGILSDSKGVCVTRLPGGSVAPLRTTTIVVPGRDGALHVTENARDEQIMQVDCYLPYDQGGTVADLSDIAAWLQGSGRLILSGDTDHYRNARINDAISFTHVVPGFNDLVFSIPFAVSPYKYSINDYAVAVPRDVPTLYSGRGNVEAYPLLKVQRGNGNPTTITINGAVLTVNYSGYIIIDCEKKIAYNDTNQILTGYLSGTWPTLSWEQAGNTIMYSGGTIGVILEPRWRWL